MMTLIKNTLKLTLVLYICVALTGVYVLSASARITPKESDEETKLITIVKGDTLWDLCQEHLKDPTKWPELRKYNDFTNPDLIYPGEKLRIPLSMAVEIAEEADDVVKIEKDELDQLRSELEESEAKREKLMADIQAMKDSTAKLQAQIKALENSLKSQDKVVDAVKKSGDDAAADIKKAVRNAKNAIVKQLEDLHGHIDSSNEMLGALQKDLKATQDSIASIQESVKSALMKIETNQKAITELNMMIKNAKGIHEEVSSGKRTLVLITTAVAGIGWFVLRSIGGRSGE
ncbi:hypothetical protein C6497_05860 [Candidatus Poribacteria bacterium]|nr:MAG: hypothetical protein C6497_05860 [Candidatus Poribacteria bacterium]